MSEVLAIVEGQSEQAFVSNVLAPHLSLRGVHLQAPLVGKVGHKGGTKRRWETVRNDLMDHLKSGVGKRVVHVTTMFDFYGMPHSWPGRTDAIQQAHAKKAPTVEAAIHTDICKALGDSFDPKLFFPYVQMHELEALIFVDPAQLEHEFVERGSAVGRLVASVAGMPPEEINDSPLTAPSKRIIQHIPEYEGAKVRAAPQVLGLIGLPALRKDCPLFANWLAKLEALAP